MKITFNTPSYKVTPNYLINPIASNVRKVNFGSVPDEFRKAVITFQDVLNMAKANPRIARLLRANGIKFKPSEKIFNDVMSGHVMNTVNVVTGILKNASPEIKAKANLQKLRKAAYLHDIGKPFIPERVFYNRAPRLSKTARGKMNLHSELSYQLLKTTEQDSDVLRLVRYHHQDLRGKGYPEAGSDFDFDINAQLLSLADKYAAIREERPYHKSMSPEKTLEIIKKQHVDTGNIGENVFQALVSYAGKEKSADINVQRKVFHFNFINGLSSIFSKRNQSADLGLVG